MVLPPGAESLDEANAAIELWEHYKRRQLDDTQRLVVEMMMATNRNGLWAAAMTGREMPRQNGKGDEVEVVELWGLIQRAERILHTVHDAVLLATETQSRLLSMIEGHPDLSRLKKRAWRGTGQQMIELRNGGIIWYRTRTGGGARGVDEVDRIVVDEAQHAEPEHLAAITPTQLASPNPQLNALGTSGITGKSAWWWTIRLRALQREAGDFGYVGHTAEQVTVDDAGRINRTQVDPTDRALWRSANPALVAGRVAERFFEEQLKVLGPELFAREHLGVWDADLGDVVPTIPPDAWDSCADPKHTPRGALVYALDVAPDGRSACVAVSDGVHIEVVAHRDGTGWVVDACTEHKDRLQRGLILDPVGPAGSLIRSLEAADIAVVQVSTRDAQQACGGLLDAVINREVRHIGQPMLNNAVNGADRRDIGDGGWLWSRKRSTIDISPLVAVTLARWAAVNHDYDVLESVL